MVVDWAVAIVAVAFVVLVGYLVPTLIQIRKTVAEAEQLLGEMRETTQTLNTMVEQSREGVERAARLLHVVGDVGESVEQVHNVVRIKSGSLVSQVLSMMAGVRAASSVINERLFREGGNSDGK